MSKEEVKVFKYVVSRDIIRQQIEDWLKENDVEVTRLAIFYLSKNQTENKSQEGVMEEILSRKLADENINTHVFLCLKYAGIHTIEDLTNKTEGDLLRIRNFGRKSLNRVINLLAEYGIKLRRR